MTVSILRSILAHQTSEYEHLIPVSVLQYGPLASQNGLGSSDPANHQRQQCVRNGEIHTAEPDLNAPTFRNSQAVRTTYKTSIQKDLRVSSTILVVQDHQAPGEPIFYGYIHFVQLDIFYSPFQ